MTDNAIKVFNYIKENEDKNITAADIAEATGLNKKSVDGTITMSLYRYKDANKNEVPLAVRVEGGVEVVNGKPKVIKYIKLTDAGREFVPTED